ncbi:MAG: alternative ribosome rescue aminoacyl-tRNA hydrolase ArfB [Spirochaetales bacterium]|uniref:Alternative ribosome rescue aminoacyl-tRNA hydrolase ArfB n=1 Tax=Candidatus Thalassospirochaeta sargassi TaxID=3119039 RepID=A0AAJ1ID92_9SPIO|nr:alternative ribosome rescue aminoacyl-tRNA hydrolase ArfB [Spirochaetales bacterium]
MTGEKNIRADIENFGRFSFSRSGGPGGQNVNKVNTNVLLTMRIEDFDSVDNGGKARIREKLSGRINSEDVLYLQMSNERSQLRNRQLAVDRMTELVLSAMKRNPVRRKTRPTKASQKRRLDDKRRRSDKKKNRRINEFE